jgi:hypothetical protein
MKQVPVIISLRLSFGHRKVIKVALRWTPEGKRKRGRPKTTWRRTIENEIRERGYTWGTMERKANNKEEWRKLVLAICAMRHNKD